jgi:hypothetical protein
MPGYNRKFDLDMADVDVIETALRERVKSLSDTRMEQACLDSQRELRAIKGLLGRLHNQKVFFRPKQGYIGG